MIRAFQLLILPAVMAAGPVRCAVTVSNLRCEYAVNPLGVDVTQPRLSWMLASGERGEKQTAYQVLVASTEENLGAGKGDLWDTGKVLSGQSIQLPYRGRALTSRRQCHWKVRVWDKAGAPTSYSEPAFWEMGLLSPKDWSAGWIGYPAGWPGRALYFRYDINLPKEVRKARAYVAGLGYYEFRINGAKIGDHVLDPAVSDYGKRVLYATYDVGAALRRGTNTLAAIAGNGWYGMPKVLLQVEVVYADGATATFKTGGLSGDSPRLRWRVTSGPILANSVYDGETYDARLEKHGWDLPGGGSGKTDRTEAWENLLPVEPPGGKLVSQMVEPIRVVDTILPRAVREPVPGVFVFDTGQNLAGWAELRVRGPRGTTVTLKFAENVNPDGTVNQENLRKASATDTYILKGGGEERWEPRFTYHGFRYVQVEGYPGRPSLDNVAVKVVRSSVAPNGSFESSSELLNRIQKMVWWTEAGNLHSIPTDCPQRDERMGWLNDMTVRIEQALYNFSLGRFYSKFLDDVSDTQAADGSITDTVPFKWGRRPADPVSASYLLLGWQLYRHYGDTYAMRRHFHHFQRWVDFLAGKAENFIVPYGYYGDWSPPIAFGVSSSIGASAVSKDTPLPFMSTGYLYYCSRLLSDMARVLDKKEESARYAALARNVADAFNRKYWNAATGGYANNNQAANSFALSLGVVPNGLRARVIANLRADVEKNAFHLTTGNLCTKYLLETLTENGHADAAYRIAVQETYPSWGFMLNNGATTLWERWEHLTGGKMNSHNHPMMGSVSSWLYKYLGGIAPESPGFKRIAIRPYPVRELSWVKTEYHSMYGPIRSAWRREGGVLRMSLTVPVNTAATVYVPGGAGSVTESGNPAAKSPGVRLLREEAGRSVFDVQSGRYEFAAPER